MEEIIHVPEEQSETGNLTEYTESVVECFDSVPEVAKPLIGSAGRLLNRIEKMLYSAPAFVGAVKAVIPEEAYQVILTDEQKAKIASGALKLMTKKDGSLMANLINPETKKIVSTVSLGFELTFLSEFKRVVRLMLDCATKHRAFIVKHPPKSHLKFIPKFYVRKLNSG